MRPSAVAQYKGLSVRRTTTESHELVNDSNGQVWAQIGSCGAITKNLIARLVISASRPR